MKKLGIIFVMALLVAASATAKNQFSFLTDMGLDVQKVTSSENFVNTSELPESRLQLTAAQAQKLLAEMKAYDTATETPASIASVRAMGDYTFILYRWNYATLIATYNASGKMTDAAALGNWCDSYERGNYVYQSNSYGEYTAKAFILHCTKSCAKCMSRNPLWSIPRDYCYTVGADGKLTLTIKKGATMGSSKVVKKAAAAINNRAYYPQSAKSTSNKK